MYNVHQFGMREMREKATASKTLAFRDQNEATPSNAPKTERKSFVSSTGFENVNNKMLRVCLFGAIEKECVYHLCAI